MKKGINYVVMLLALLVLSSISVDAQDLKKADEYYAGGAYFGAGRLYREIVNLKNNKNSDVKKRRPEILFRIGECYRKMNKPEDAEKFYEQAQSAGYDDADLYYSLGCVQLLRGQYEKAKESFLLSKDRNLGDTRLESKIQSCEIHELYGRVNTLHDIIPVDNLNTRGSEYGLSFFEEQLIYASTGVARPKTTLSQRTGLPFSDLYIAKPDSRSLYGDIKKMESVTDEKANEGTFCYDLQTGQLYCTRCEEGNKDCYIVKIDVKDGRYKESGRLKLGNVTYGIGHPCITNDGKRIYFTSVKEGGFGGADLWYVDRNASGDYGEPVNLGPNVNTEGSEVFPAFIDGVLYFASDGHPGLGGLDLFASRMDEDGNFGKPFNLRAPFNTSWDDFNLINHPGNKSGLFISNRKNAVSSDDIYMFNGFPPSVITLTGNVYDDETKELVDEYTIEIVDGENKIYEKTITDKSDYFTYVAPDKNYVINVTSPTYDDKKQSFSTVDILNFSELRADTYLDKEVEESIVLKTGDSAKMMVIEMKDIFYEFNKSRLTEESRKELDNYISYFDEYPEMKVEIGSHTDARGTSAYNQKLSEARAKSVVDYLVTRGIAQNRLVWRGYGKEDLLVKNARNEAEHQANRRTIFKVLTLGLHAENVVIKHVSAQDMYNSTGGTVSLSGYWVQVHVSASDKNLDLPLVQQSERVTGKQVRLIKNDDGKYHYCIHYDTRNEAVLAQIDLYRANITKTIILQF